jgi:DNA polymerase-3 subunit gamma/tau
MMATTAIDKVPATMQSRSQVFELKSVGLKAIADQLRKIADAESLQVDDAALMLIARAADGSVRDALSALDQVVGFAGSAVDAESVTTVLGLVRRDLVLDVMEAVAAENAPAVFELAGRAVESGYDLRQVCRELARAVRDVLVLSVDPSRVSDPEIAQEGERERLQDLAQKYSHEDLMRAFDVLARAEFEIRGAAQPRYHLEMALLKWIHLRKLVPLTDVIAGLEGGGTPRLPSLPTPTRQTPPAPARPFAPPRPGPPTPMGRGNAGQARSAPAAEALRQPPAAAPAPPPRPAPSVAPASVPAGNFKDAFLSQIRTEKKFFYGTVVAQAHRIDVHGDQVVFTFTPTHKALRAQLEQHRPWLEGIAENVAGRRISVGTAETAGAAESPAAPAATGAAASNEQEALRAKAMESDGVQALLDVFGAEIKEIEEM